MDFDTARRFLLAQTVSPVPGQTPFIECLRQGVAPVPGQVTSLLLALKTVSQTLKDEPTIAKSLGLALFILSYESRQLYLQGQRNRVDWPPLLDEDLTRIAEAVRTIWANGANENYR
ncbi:Dethiobiotin synthetase [Oscillatoria sp. CS-180]|uniref:Dethiobiotin synthetase n=1 Tax=Oscillatoria sp. CS-180 TaxID=3021720 RepID=UPI00232E8936|nr:Dethiobiotin synthetase [Oscillatoria sp. CS-180]MDB9528028.1 Dethiobiotin synthetase [Oscillatoria sp. CS-180]